MIVKLNNWYYITVLETIELRAKKKKKRRALACLEILTKNYSFANHIYKQDLALDNIKGLICHKIQLTN